MKLSFLLIVGAILYLKANSASVGWRKQRLYPYRIIKRIKSRFLKYGLRSTETPPPVDLLYVIDGSVYYRNSYKDALTAVRRMSSFFSISPGTTRVAIITYNEKVTTYSTFSNYHNRVALYKLLYRISKNGPPQHYGYSQRHQSRMSKSFLKSNIGSVMKEAANLFNTSFTRPNTLKLLVTFTSGRYESGCDRVKFKDAMSSLKIQGIKRVTFAAKKNKVIEELSLKKSQNVFYLFGYHLKYVADRLWRYLPKKENYQRCYGRGIVADECNRHCTCSYGQLRNCKRIRYEFNSMSRNGKLQYVKTLIKLTTDVIYKPRYENFIRIHSRNFFSRIHQSSEFLPWHRWYILEMENLLKEVDCRVTIPYWDWSLVSNDPFNNTMLFSDDYLGSHPPNVSSCVENGPFGTKAGWTIEAGGCLERSFQGKPPSVADVQRATNVPSFQRFEVILRVALHDLVHCVIGGTMCGLDSANAPSFFLHHGFIDKIWWDAQQKNKVFYKGIYQNQTENMVASPYRPNQFLNLHDQPGDVNVQYANATINDAAKVSKMIRKMTTSQLEKMARVKISMRQLNEAYKVFKITDQDMNIAKKYWMTGERHPLPRKKLTGPSHQLGFDVNLN